MVNISRHTRCICRGLTVSRPVLNGRTCAEFGRWPLFSLRTESCCISHSATASHTRMPKLACAAARARIQFRPSLGAGMHSCQVCRGIKVVYSLSFSRDRSELNVDLSELSAAKGGFGVRAEASAVALRKSRAPQLCNHQCALIYSM